MSQNQFPGQGGQQFPQGGQQFPQGGQQFPQGGQQFPQGGQQFPQGGQQFPQGGQQYPQGGQQYPQGGQQYPPAGQGPGGYGQPPGGPQGPYQPQPPKPKSNGMVIGVVVAGLLAVGLLGWLLMSLFGNRGGDPDPGPTVQPSPGISSTAPTPEPSPSESPSGDPSPSTSPSTTAPSGDSLEVGLGVTVSPASGWQQADRDETKNFTVLTNGKGILVTQAFRVEGSPTGKDVVTSYMNQITEQMTGVSKKEPSTLDVKTDRLSVGVATWSGTRATSQGSQKLTYLAIISVRDDGLTVLSALIVPSGVTVTSQQEDYLAMTNSVMSSQLKA